MSDLNKLNKAELVRRLRESEDALEHERQSEKKLLHELQAQQIELERQYHELRKAEQQQREAYDRIANLYDFAPVGYLTLNRAGVVSEVNFTASRMLGMPRSRLIGRPLITRVASSSRNAFYSHLKVVGKMKEHTTTTEIEITPHDSNELLHIRLESCAEILDDGDYNCRTVMLDITERKWAEEEKAMAMVAMHEAKASNRAKSEFLTRMSHELRTPLNAIIGFSQLLAVDKDRLDYAQLDSVQHISSAGEHLLYLINEILDITQIDSGKMKFSITEVPLSEVFESTMMLMKNLAKEKGVILHKPKEVSFSVKADAMRLKQVLINLFTNAIKYSNSGDSVSTNFTEDSENKLRIGITDTGVGIKQSDQELIFEPFYRVKQHNKLIDGTGIGLSVVKKLVEAMKGQVGVKSEYGKGTTIWFELPLAEALLTSPTDEQQEQHTPTKNEIKREELKILYIEDDRASANLIRQFFQQWGDINLLLAPNAEKGIEIAQEKLPSLILMDIDLPGEDGFTAIKHLQSGSETTDIPVIAVSAHAMPEHIEKGFNAGFADYVTKPVKIEQLKASIEKVLR